MDFLDFMHKMLTLKEEFPDMVWNVESSEWANAVYITIPVSKETAELLEQARQMFAPLPQTGDYDY